MLTLMVTLHVCLSAIACCCLGTAPQMYLTDVQEGGETVFPHVPKLPDQMAENGWSDCALKVNTLVHYGLECACCVAPK
jgi:hypothetical protein